MMTTDLPHQPQAGASLAIASGRVNAPVSDGELARRWHLVRSAMKDRGIDVLVMQCNNDFMGGYVRWFTDYPAMHGYPSTVVFPLDDEMTFIRNGAKGKVEELRGGTNGIFRGVKRIVSTPSFSTVCYTNAYDSELASRELASYARATIGLLGLHQISHATVDRLKGDLPGATFVDASDMVDRIKAVKSAEEKELAHRTARIQDGAMRYCFDTIRPGMTEREAASLAQTYAYDHGAEMGLFLCTSYPFGQPGRLAPWHLNNRTISKGDAFALLVETNGPGGMYAELGRTCVLGPVPEVMVEELEFAKTARQFVLDLLQQGATYRSVWEEYNAFMVRNDRPPEERLFCHGQGCDLVERPLIRDDETMPVVGPINISLHPTYVRNGVMSWICDNYWLESGVPPQRLHAMEEEIVSVSH